jgi:exopolyphosphatase/guanosine-5'-triphosphate,3'-diphosphate pyrophosphatase
VSANNPGNHREPILAVVDIGSNSIKILVAASRESTLRVLFQETLETRISGGLGQERSRLGEAGMAAGIEAIQKLRDMARPYAPTNYRIVATSAVRDAANRADFAARVQAATSVPLEILSGEDEALLIARGIQTDPALGGVKEFCILDLGGGSLECINYADGAIRQAVSLQLGSVRLTEKFVHQVHGAFPDAARTAIEQETRRAVSASGFHFIPGGIVVGTGGAFTVARAIFAHRRGFIAKETWPAEISRADVAALLDEIAPLDTAARAKIPRLTPERADIMPAALTTMLTLFELAGMERALHSFNNLRFGVAARFFAQLRGEL